MKDSKGSRASCLDSIAQAWSVSIGQLSHALATKMATLQLKQQGLGKVIPNLLNGYHLAVKHHLIESEISEKTLQRLEDMQNLDEQLNPMFGFLEQLNVYSSMIARHEGTEMHAQQCLGEFLANYPFAQDSERSLVKMDASHDFKFTSSFLFIETSLRHLLAAALQRIKKAGKGEVQIWVSDEDGDHVFNIKDTSQSLTDEQFNNLFNYFLFEPYEKTRPGLGLCRLAMLHIGGDIICDTVNDESTHFKIIFPKNGLNIKDRT